MNKIQGRTSEQTVVYLGHNKPTLLEVWNPLCLLIEDPNSSKLIGNSW